jgi:signal transduction histidine kinase
MAERGRGDGEEVRSALGRVNRLGAATSRLFSRLYHGLGVQARQSDSRAGQLEKQSQKAQLIFERNRRLSEILYEREAEIERLNGILATIDEGIIMQDVDGRVVLFNTAAQRLLGSHKNLWETELGTLFDAYRDVELLDSELAPLGEPTRVQVNNRIVGAQLAAVANSQGERIGTMIVLRDVTRDAVADRLKDQFVTAISHELRTPMTVIKGASEVLASAPADQPANRRLLETLTRNVDTLDRMVVELLDISEMGAGTFSVRDAIVPLEPLLWSVVNGMVAEVRRGKLDVAFAVRDSEQLVVSGDEQRLRWAFGHLLQNSIRYTEPGGYILVSAGLDARDPRTLLIEVIDSGVGISEKDLPHVFERFYRGEPRTRSGKLLDPRGLGQGLFVARAVAEAHQGYLSVRSKVGMGSTFTMALPAVALLPAADLRPA